MSNTLEPILKDLRACCPKFSAGRVAGISGDKIEIANLAHKLTIGDRVDIKTRSSGSVACEVTQVSGVTALVLPNTSTNGVMLGDIAVLKGQRPFRPCTAWKGRVLDPFGTALDGRPLPQGQQDHPVEQQPIPAVQRAPLGAQLETGMNALNTFLPIVRGQRLGLFAGSGVGKSSLLGELARNLSADVVVIALIGERNREVMEFVTDVLGDVGMARSVVIAATSDQPATVRRRCAWAAMSTAEFFRDQGLDVLLLADSVTRFAEAHREICTSRGEPANFRGHPASVSSQLASLCERAGMGRPDQGSITAIFSVLVAGSDMEEPIADTMRGLLDGHIVLSRSIAERGRFPAIDINASVSRSANKALSVDGIEAANDARSLLRAYEDIKPMLQAGLYSAGSDPVADRAVRLWPELDIFIASNAAGGCADSLAKLRVLLRR